MYDQTNKKLVRQRLGRLKRCPLCDSINVRSNTDCVVCGWSGKFIHDPELIAEGLDHLLEGEQDVELDWTPYTMPRMTWFDSVRAWWARVRRRIDIRV